MTKTYCQAIESSAKAAGAIFEEHSYLKDSRWVCQPNMHVLNLKLFYRWPSNLD